MFYAGAGLAQHVLDAYQRSRRSRLPASASCSCRASARPKPRPRARLTGNRARRQYRPAAARRRIETRAARRQARSAAQRPQHHARLLARAGADRRRVRRGRLLQDRRRVEVRRSGRSGAGLAFDGRLAEDFKLATGTWVSVGPLRAAFIAHFAPLVRDVVLAGADRDEVTALVFPDLDACRKLAPDFAADIPPRALLPISASGRFRAAARCILAAAAARRAASSARPARRAAVDRYRRNHRQRIDQPARGACQSRALVEELYAERAAAATLLVADARQTRAVN